jgi:hypothetical protein
MGAIKAALHCLICRLFVICRLFDICTLLDNIGYLFDIRIFEIENAEVALCQNKNQNLMSFEPSCAPGRCLIYSVTILQSIISDPCSGPRCRRDVGPVSEKRPIGQFWNTRIHGNLEFKVFSLQFSDKPRKSYPIISH